MWERRIRTYSGLLVGIFVVLHLINHALGLISMEAMEAMREFMEPVFGEPPGALVLLLALLAHFVLSLASLYRRSTLRMPFWEGAQLALGILIFPLILAHVAGTLMAGQMLDFDPTYEYVISALWVADPVRGAQQTVLLFVVWGHFCVGIHFWLRIRTWYRAWLPVIYGAAVAIPILSFLGFANVGQDLQSIADRDPDFLNRVFKPIIDSDPNMVADLTRIEPNGWYVFAAILGFVLLARLGRRWHRNRHGTYRIALPDGNVITAPVGATILDSLREEGVEHAAVCGGRGRCTTCRVHVGDAVGHLDPPGEVEETALTRVGLEPEVRLACQCRPREDLSITPLLPPTATAAQANARGGIQGREQEVASMFIDLRGSTKLGEEKLPYDVLFILNQFFAEMSSALSETDGHYAEFTGDGLMALYGIEGPIEEGCRNAIRGAASMAERLDQLNQRLAHEVREPLRMGIGIHAGEAIVGTMGPPTAQNFSAIGDTINTSARLESLTKEFGCFLVLSEEAAKIAGADLRALTPRETSVRGRDGAVCVYAIADPRTISFVETPA